MAHLTEHEAILSHESEPVAGPAAADDLSLTHDRPLAGVHILGYAHGHPQGFHDLPLKDSFPLGGTRKANHIFAR